MKRERAGMSVGHVLYASTRGFTPMMVAAAVSVLVLLAVVGWRVDHMNDVPATTVAQGDEPASGEADVTAPYAQPVSSETPADASSSDPLSQLGDSVIGALATDYAGLQQLGIYSTSTANAAADQVLPLLQANVGYRTFAPKDLKTDADTSYARMLAYRADLRDSLAPLLNNTEPEYEIFAYYVETGDKSYVAKLQSVAQDYFDAASSTAKVAVPKDAATYHVAILNAMEEFGTTLDAMAAHADDPFATAALLQSYNQAENDMLTSFNALTTYYKSKSQ